MDDIIINLIINLVSSAIWAIVAWIARPGKSRPDKSKFIIWMIAIIISLAPPTVLLSLLGASLGKFFGQDINSQFNWTVAIVASFVALYGASWGTVIRPWLEDKI